MHVVHAGERMMRRRISEEREFLLLLQEIAPLSSPEQRFAAQPERR
jgi:hypothetical protein